MLNRINVFLVAYKPLYAEQSYFPSAMEIMVTVGLIAALVLLYRLLVINFPVISIPVDDDIVSEAISMKTQRTKVG